METAAICCACAIKAKDVIEAGEKIHEYAKKFHDYCHKLPVDEHGNEIHEIAQVQVDYEDALAQVEAEDDALAQVQAADEDALLAQGIRTTKKGLAQVEGNRCKARIQRQNCKWW